MKQELTKLRDLTNEYSQAKKKFEEEKEIFNENTKNTMVILSDCVVAANYEAACDFYEEYKTLIAQARKLKAEHPRYGQKRVSETLTEIFKGIDEYKDRTLCVGQIIDAYLTFEKNGFEEVKMSEQHANEVAVLLAQRVETVKSEKIDSAVEGFNKAIETVKPYGEVAKKQIGRFGNFAKGAITTGAKRLVKILEQQNDSDNDTE